MHFVLAVTVQVPFLPQQCHADVGLISGLDGVPEGLLVVPQSIFYHGVDVVLFSLSHLAPTFFLVESVGRPVVGFLGSSKKSFFFFSVVIA